jgi:hypothetical protein
MSRPEPAFIEIIERVPDTETLEQAEAKTAGYIKPNEVRINGIPLAVPVSELIEVHAIQVGADDVLQVTLTLFAKRVTIGAEPRVVGGGGDSPTGLGHDRDT